MQQENGDSHENRYYSNVATEVLVCSVMGHDVNMALCHRT